jgi:subtilisin family serine protease
VTWFDNLAEDRLSHEAGIIVRAFADRGVDIGGVATEDGGIGHMYAKDRILVRQQYLGGEGGSHETQEIGNASTRRGVLDVLSDLGVSNVSVRPVIRDIAVVTINPERPENASEEDEEERDALFHLSRIEEEFGPRIATLDHVLTTTQGRPSKCPATEPQEVYDPSPYPAVCPGTDGHGVRVYVADTGIVEDTVAGCPWLTGVTGEPDPAVGANEIGPYGGHGTFVAGVIRSQAPGADIVVRNVFDTAGSALESEFVAKLYAGFGFGADIFHITVSSLTRNNLPLLAFETWLEDLRQHKGTVCVVPAGNNESRRPHWPAAFPELISVGALGLDWRNRAYFTNYGGWVDVYAPGQSLVNAFATGTFTCQVAPFKDEIRSFTGTAQWSGTSFSTPIVTGLIAARMTQRGESAQEAAAALLAQARAHANPDTGPILLPRTGDEEL